MMNKAVQIYEHGGPEKLVYEDIVVGQPGAGEALVRHSAIGLNFIDIYHRTGLYPFSDFPVTLGMEGAGVVEAIGEGVSDVTVGDRVAYAGMPLGAYATSRVLPSAMLVKVPDTISDELAAAMMLQGMTAQYLIRSTYRVKQGETILLHAAAGGVGLILCQWAKSLGVSVIGTVGSEEKATLARAHGCEHTILYNDENFTERVQEITGGKGVPVVYDSIGKDTFEGSLDCLSPRGYMVSFGNASGAVPPFEPAILAQKGSIFITRPTLMTYTATREDLMACANELFDVVASGAVKININQRYPLSETAQAHRDLEARKTTGSTILLPE
jgi:NADPH2:quinone reductase